MSDNGLIMKGKAGLLEKKRGVQFFCVSKKVGFIPWKIPWRRGIMRKREGKKMDYISLTRNMHVMGVR